MGTEAARPAWDDSGVVVVLVDAAAAEYTDEAGVAVGVWRGEEEPRQLRRHLRGSAVLERLQTRGAGVVRAVAVLRARDATENLV